LDSSLVIAAIGVAGTLVASTLSPLISERSKRREFERARAERLEQAERDEKRVRRLELRQGYITFNAAARDYHRSLRAWSYVADNGTDRAAETVELPQTRQAFQTAYAEAQMIVSAPVLVLAQQIARGLADAYGILKHARTARTIPSPIRRRRRATFSRRHGGRCVRSGSRCEPTLTCRRMRRLSECADRSLIEAGQCSGHGSRQWLSGAPHRSLGQGGAGGGRRLQGASAKPR
jgi:hypothetical protein